MRSRRGYRPDAYHHGDLRRALLDETLVPDPADGSAAVLAAWGVVHGLAALLVDGPLRALAGDPARVRPLVEAAVGSFDLGGAVLAGTARDAP